MAAIGLRLKFTLRNYRLFPVHVRGGVVLFDLPRWVMSGAEAVGGQTNVTV